MTLKNQSPNVALSYAAELEEYATEVELALRREGYEVYNYKGEARRSTTAKSLPVQLTEVFKTADLCVLMVSESYAESTLCQQESATAHSRLEDCLILGTFGDAPAPIGAMPNAEYVKLDDMPAATFARTRVLTALREKSILPKEEAPPSKKEQSYGLFFGIPDYRIAYIPASWQRSWDKFKSYEFHQLEVTARQQEFRLEAPYCDWVVARTAPENLLKCRLDSYTDDQSRLRLQIQPTWYEDYLRSGEQLDFTVTADGDTTFREKFLNGISPHEGVLRPFKELTNICGIGLFVVTSDNQIIVSTHSHSSHVYPGRRTFAASGTMPWGACPNPFTAVIIKAQEELQHLVDWKRLSLFGFGVDARKLYFQFSFVEDKSAFSAEKILAHYEAWRKKSRNQPRDLKSLELHEDVIAEALVQDCWEPAAEAAILTLLSSKVGKDKVRAALERHQPDWWKRRMRDEWDHRASRSGVLADMSPRYPADTLEEASGRYVQHVRKFLENHIAGKSVVEIGSGTGRISEALVSLKPSSLTCIELSPAMEARHRARLGDAADCVRYDIGFAQDRLRKSQRYEVAVCSLVLIHNVGDLELETLLEVLARTSVRVFLFEDIQKRECSPVTRILSKPELLKRLQPYFAVEHEQIYPLFDDRILSLQLKSK